IYTSDPEKLSLAATMPRFLDMERRHGSLIRAMRRRDTTPTERQSESGARFGLFATLRNGLTEVVEVIAAAIRGPTDIRTGAAVVHLRTAASRHAASPDASSPAWSLELADGSRIDADAVILALPAWKSAELLAAADVSLAAALNEIEYASSVVVATGHRLEDVAHPLDAFGLVVPAIEHRRVLAVSFASRKFPGRAPGGHVLLRTFVGGALQPELADRDDAELTRIVCDELSAMLGVRDRPQFTLVARHPRAMPQYHVGHLERVARIDELVGAHARLALAGNAYHGVGLPDCIASGRRAAERVLAQAGC
ncbi:MAG: protoporphyrinogen oxidase, partial [Planctomycetes bacterium]|nr:protoporphyrinogen oxidase [Planctomycetota bacterium]